LHGKLADLPRTLEPALDIACPTTREISHRQGKKFSTQKIENYRIESHGRKGQQIFLDESGELHENDRR
jgi:hypothetical protein